MSEPSRWLDDAKKRFYVILVKEWPVVLMAAGLGALTAGAGTGLMATSAWLIATAALHPAVTELSVAIVGVRFFGISRAVLRYLERYVSHDAVFRLLGALRVWFYETLEPLVPGGDRQWERGDLAGRLAADVEVLKYFYLRVLFPTLAAILTAGVALAVAGLAAPDFGLLGLLVILFTFSGLLLPGGTWRWSRSEGENCGKQRDQLNAVLTDTLEGMGELTTGGRQQEQLKLLEQSTQGASAGRQRLRQGVFLAGALNRFVLDVAVVGVIFWAVPLIRSNALPGVWLPVVTLAVQSLGEVLLPLTWAAYHLAESRLALTRLFGLGYDHGEATRDVLPDASHGDRSGAGAVVTGEKSHARTSACFAVQGLSFRYRPTGPLVLADISFQVPAGGRLTIVGPSGAGKSTLAHVLTGLLQPTSGIVSVANKDISRWDPEELRAQWGVVTQDTYIFDASIADNVRLARPSASLEELTVAMTQAGLGSWLASLPRGAATLVGQNGLALSGGERQRLALARVLLKNAPLLILDEPTAGLDPVTEQSVMVNLKQFMAGRGTIVITHRLAGLENQDEVMILDQGRVSVQGRWSHLLANNRLAQRLWKLHQEALDGDLTK